MPPAQAPRVSVIIRTKDRPRLLARALDDVLRQDFESWEVLVVNDGGNAVVVDALLGERPAFRGRARAIHVPQSRGMEAASNLGVAAATGEFLAVHDDDDTWAPDYLSATVDVLDSSPEAVAVTASTEIIIERLEDDSIVEVRREPFGPPHDVVTVFDLIVVNRFVPISLLVRRTVIVELGGFDDSLPVVGDWEFHLRLALHGQIEYLGGPPRAFWHQRPDTTGALSNSVHSANELHRRQDRLVRDRAIRAYADENGVGALLYLSKFIDERLAAAEYHTYQQVQATIAAQRDDATAAEKRMTNAIVESLRYYSLGATVRRNVRRFFGRRR